MKTKLLKYQEVDGDLIKLAQKGEFDVIAHGCNCFCTMGAGIAPQMAKAFNVDKYPKEEICHRGNINKLGNIEYRLFEWEPNEYMNVVNCYTQFGISSTEHVPLSYSALTLCLQKMNYLFNGQHIGLPQIGCGLAGGNWDLVQRMIQSKLKDCKVTVVIYKQ
jgi:O-acetyl-ADP-ribose deacetylase (regulator of RNase III)